MNYRSEIHAEGPVYGTGHTAHHILGTHHTISPVLALRWLSGQALHIADRLDPDPASTPWLPPAARQATAPEPDGPTDLRIWAEDRKEQRVARERIKTGHPLFVVIPDRDCTYTLFACRHHADAPPPPPPPGQTMHQCEATTAVPPVALLVAILAGQGRVLGNDLGYAPTRARCELGTRHQGEHADHVWDWDHEPTHALWARWNTGSVLRYESLPWCETAGGPQNDACTLYWNHPHPHAWALHDPETDALLRKALAPRPDLPQRPKQEPN
ncbi:hypothetical protein ACFVT5_04830 [Streptomyces sp. NPDC058001]|uniref:hypothetical protein n=1 Tax=Streptomyces sp. NPDC058001 TaxID=3346300 RepID=UPI0036EC6036